MVKPDQLIKRRGKLGLIKVNVDFQGCKAWLDENLGKEIKVSCSKAVIMYCFVHYHSEREFNASTGKCMFIFKAIVVKGLS